MYVNMQYLDLSGRSFRAKTNGRVGQKTMGKSLTLTNIFRNVLEQIIYDECTGI